MTKKRPSRSWESVNERRVLKEFDYAGYAREVNRELHKMYLQVWNRDRIILIETLILIGVLIWGMRH